MFPFRSKKYQKKQQVQTPLPQGDISLAASQWILRREQLPEYRFALALLSQDEKEAVFWRDWERLDTFAQRDLVKATYSDKWYDLLATYPELPPALRAQVLEALGYIHNEHVVDFLLQEMKRDDDGIRLAASAAMKKQDPLLTIEPMLDALAKPEVFLASRVYDVLKAIGPKLVPIILKKIETTDTTGQVVMIQLLGAFGDTTVIPVLGEMALQGDYKIRKVAVEALTQIGTDAIWPILNLLIDDPNWQIRLLVVDAIGRNHLVQAQDVLRGCLEKEDDLLVRDMIQELLGVVEDAQLPTATKWSRAQKGQVEANGNNIREFTRSSSRSSERHSRQEQHLGPAHRTGKFI